MGWGGLWDSLAGGLGQPSVGDDSAEQKELGKTAGSFLREMGTVVSDRLGQECS